jgi:hypothetical protein
MLSDRLCKMNSEKSPTSKYYTGRGENKVLNIIKQLLRDYDFI